MADAFIENPILNSPFAEPTRHFKFTDEGITDEIVEGRRISSYFIPIARPRRRASSSSSTPNGPRTASRRTSSSTAIRRASASGGRRLPRRHPDHGRLLEYWTDPDASESSSSARSRPSKPSSTSPRSPGNSATPGSRTASARPTTPPTPACRASPSRWPPARGKTVVMAMLIAWQALNKLANPQDARFSDAFLIVTPGITIRDRLRVLLPNDPRQLLPRARHRPGRSARPARPGQDRDHQLSRLPAPREDRRRQD